MLLGRATRQNLWSARPNRKSSLARAGRPISSPAKTLYCPSCRFYVSVFASFSKEQCHISKILEMPPHLPWEMPRLQRETRHPHSGDAVIHYWRCKISFRDAHPSHPHLHLSREVSHLPQEMWWHLQNLGYVTLLVIYNK